jgi:hypothetical protein
MEGKKVVLRTSFDSKGWIISSIAGDKELDQTLTPLRINRTHNTLKSDIQTVEKQIKTNPTYLKFRRLTNANMSAIQTMQKEIQQNERGYKPQICLIAISALMSYLTFAANIGANYGRNILGLTDQALSNSTLEDRKSFEKWIFGCYIGIFLILFAGLSLIGIFQISTAHQEKK